VTTAASLVRRPAAGPPRATTVVNRTTTVVNRPGAVVNRTTNITNTTVNRTNIRQVNVNRNVSFNQTTVVNRRGPGWGGWGAARSSYVGWGSDGGWHGRYQYLHDDWYHGGWGFMHNRPVGAFVAGVAFGWLASLGRDVTYQNPYCSPPPEGVFVAQALDYSRPISVPEPEYDAAPADVPYDSPPEGPDQYGPPPLYPDSGDQGAPPPLPDRTDDQAAPPPLDSAGPPGAADDPEAQEAAKKTFDDARAAFRSGDYAQAQDLVEQALRNVPGDATMHEFRALTLFAQGQYRDAAGAVYAVLSAGPGWNWDTLKTLYPDTQTYTAQLRDLENYQRRHPDAPEASFLLAYQYLTLGSTDAAVKMLRQTVSVNPKDELSAQLVKMLTQQQDADDRPAPQP
jgi:TolA-binding protein